MRQEARRPTPAGPEARYVRVGPEFGGFGKTGWLADLTAPVKRQWVR
jgi:hypothetical protein